MRVAHFCDCEPGRTDGVAASVGLTVALQRAAGYDVRHIHPGRLFGATRAGAMRSVPVPGRLLRVAWPWSDGEQAADADIVHVHTTGPVGMAGFRLAAARGIPLVVSWHTDLVAYARHFPEVALGACYDAARLRLGWTPGEHLELLVPARRRARLLALGRGFADRAAVFVAPSAKAAGLLTEFGDLPPVRVIPTPVLGVAGAVAGPARAAPVVLAVGRVTAEKNPDLLLDAFAQVRARLPAARLVLLGVRQNRRRIRRRIRSLGLAGAVRLLRPVPRAEVAAWYRSADVLAFASTTDTQSLVVAEAEATGLPIVLADPALADRPGDPASRRVTCAPRPAALAGALVDMLTDGGLRERTSRAGLEAAGVYSGERFLALLSEAYEAARRSPRRTASR